MSRSVYFMTMVMINVSMLAMFFVVLLIVSWNKSSKRLAFCLFKVSISQIVHNQNTDKGHRLALTNIIVMK